jgi:hypothetical protein
MRVLCRWGWHSWQFISMGQRREITIPGYTTYVARLTERCRRCGLRRTNDSAPIPRRVRV